jgi:hypothetical protein
MIGAKFVGPESQMERRYNTLSIGLVNQPYSKPHDLTPKLHGADRIRIRRHQPVDANNEWIGLKGEMKVKVQ